jgi:diguanylate cyclase (GGDEF)-like protein
MPGVSHSFIRETRLSDLYLSDAPHSEYLVSLSVPIEKNKTFYGYVVGVIKPYSFLSIIQENSMKDTNITLIDRQNKIIISNQPANKTGAVFEEPGNEISIDELFNSKNDESFSTLQDWTKMSYSEEFMGDSDFPWKLRVTVPVADYKNELYQKYISMFSYAYLFSAIAFFISFIISRWMQASLMKIGQLTTNLPDKIFLNEKINWPDAAINEAAHIVHNFKETEKKLKKMFREIVENKENLQYLAHYDPLTNLYNRAYFIQQLNQKIKDDDGDSDMAVLFIDLDRFKIVNDTLGHEAGDYLLTEVSSRLLEKSSKDWIISRLGGDEFIILVPSYEKQIMIEEYAQILIESLSKPYLLRGNEFHLTASVGISLFPADAADVQTLIKYADIAMYDAKDRGKNNYQFYNTSINNRMMTKLEMENELRQAIERDQLELYYQPQVNLKTGRVIGTEALIRWNHPTLGFVSPAEFIPIAEETGQIIKIGEWVINTACKQAKQWHDKGLDHLMMSVNISMRQFLHEDLIPSIINALQVNDLDPEFLKLEITESAAMLHPDQVLRKLDTLKELKIELALDDFGTGYSSLHYLKKLPVDILKIDRSFIVDIDHDDDYTMVKALIEVAHHLGMTVIAEGVETEQQKEKLRNMHCDYIQGYVFSKPLPSEEAEQLLLPVHA